MKMKTMRKDNPHLQKRHGQRRKNRRFSMQAFQRHAGAPTPASTTFTGPISTVFSGAEKTEHDPTKTPEDSTGSHNEQMHLAGVSVRHGSVDESDEAHAHGRTLSDLTSSMASTSGGQRVTFK